MSHAGSGNPGGGLNGMFDRFDNWMSGGKKKEVVPPNNNASDPNHNNNNNNNNNNNQPDPVEQIWAEAEKAKTDPNTNNNNNNNNNNQPAPPAADPKKQISDYMAKVGLSSVSLTDADMEAIKGGDPASLKAAIDGVNDRIQRAHIESVKASQTLIDGAVKKAVEEALDKSKSFIEGKELRNLLHENLPFTKDPSIGPVAETVMGKFLEKGATPAKALELTREWFERTIMKVDPTLKPNMNTNDSFRRTPQNPDADTNWLDALSGK